MGSAISDMDIEALVDGELEPEMAIVIRTAISSDLELQHRYDSIQRQRRLLADAFNDPDQRIVH